MRTKEWLINKRKEKGITQQQLADSIDLSRYAIENIEQGRRMGSVDTWDKIESFFEDEENIRLSYDSEDLIDELQKDIAEFGEDWPCILVYKEIYGYIVFTNYDFITDEKPFEPKKELQKDEKYIESTLKYALDVFTVQNKSI